MKTMKNITTVLATAILAITVPALPIQAAQGNQVPQIVKTYAPILSFHPDEGSQCCYPGDAEQAFPEALSWASTDGRTVGTFGPHFSREPKTLNPNAPCYYQLAENCQHCEIGNITRIKYWFWYGFNDFPECPDVGGSHPGDWESVEVILIGEQVHVYLLSNHTGYIAVWPDQTPYVYDSHIKVWVGSGSHANYPAPNSKGYCYEIEVIGASCCDRIADGGSVWYTENNLKGLAGKDPPLNFAAYQGYWGDPLSPTCTETTDGKHNRQFENQIPFYRIWVYTADEDGAGTDGDVYATIYGTRGVSSEFHLDNYENNFERNALDMFSPGTNCELGDLKLLRIRHVSLVGSWLLDSVAVENMRTGQRWDFNASHWFEPMEDVVGLDTYSSSSLVFSEYDPAVCSYGHGEILSFPKGTGVTAACPGGYMRFAGGRGLFTPSRSTWLISTTNEGFLEWIQVRNGGIRVYNGASIKFP
jgi:hypothetical protein